MWALRRDHEPCRNEITTNDRPKLTPAMQSWPYHWYTTIWRIIFLFYMRQMSVSDTLLSADLSSDLYTQVVSDIQAV